MRQLRALWGAVLISAAIAGGYFIVRGPTATPISTLHMMDRRCRGGCTDSALLRVLPGGVSPSQTATGSLSGSNGQAITTTRASTKTCTRSDGVLVTLSSNQPCVETLVSGMNGGSGLLVEGAGTNLALWSEQLDNATAWNVNAGAGASAPTVTANACTAPDGTLTGESVTFPVVASGQWAQLYQNISATSGTAYTETFYVKGTGSPSSGTIYLNAQSAFTIPTTSSCAFNSTSYVRCTLTATASSTATGNFVIGVNNGVEGNPVTGAQTLCVTKAQVEASPFATSYIATTSASASRAADVVSVANPLTAAFPYCIAMTGTPEGGSAWGLGVEREPFSLGVESTANSARLVETVGSFYWVEYNPANNYRGTTVADSLSAGTSHRFVVSRSATATYPLLIDGVSVGSGTTSGSPTGLATQPGALYIGGSGSTFWGYLSDIEVATSGCL